MLLSGAPEYISRAKMFVNLVDNRCEVSEIRNLNLLLSNKQKLWGFLVVRCCLDKSKCLDIKCSKSGQFNLSHKF